MPRSIPDMIEAVTNLRDQLEVTLVEGQAVRQLYGIFDEAERGLAQELRAFRTLDTDTTGRIVRSTANVDRAGRIATDLRVKIDHWILDPGRRWADRMLPVMQGAGRQIARMNLDVDLVSQDLIDEVFAHVPRTERAVLRVGKAQAYQIMGTVGDDVQDWFRNELLDAVTNGLPIQGRGSLAQRLMESGRLRPIAIRTDKGRLIRRSLRQRANAIARIESVKLINGVHDALGERALGKEMVGKNSNPRDSRTTDVCARASREEPMSKQEWAESRYGLPPRLDGPFHFCRSFIIWGRRDWFEEEGDRPKKKAPPRKKRPPRRPRDAKPDPTAITAAAEKARLADIALARNVDAPVQDRIAAYGRVAGAAKIDQIKALSKHQPASGHAAIQAELKQIDTTLERSNSRLDALFVELNDLETPELRKKYPSIHNRRRAVPRLEAIYTELDEVAAEMDRLGMRKAELHAKGLDAGAAAGGATAELRAEVARVLRTEGDGIDSRVPQARSGRNLADRQQAVEAVEEGREFVSEILDPKATTTGEAHEVSVKWIGGRAFARRGGMARVRRPSRRRGESMSEYLDRTADRERVKMVPHSVHLNNTGRSSRGLEGTSTAVHEYGHTVEYATSAGGMSEQFVRYRAGAGAEFKTMRGWGFSWYKDPQRAHPDRFRDVMESWAGDHVDEYAAYTGKLYGHGTTEVLSMGIEAFWRDPIGFVTKDPEWANYIFGVLDGSFKP